MARYYYSAPVHTFLVEDESQILGKLLSHFGHQNLTNQARNAWQWQIRILKDALQSFTHEQLYFEFAIPRMGKRADNILLLGNAVCVLEFKVGAREYGSYIDQVVDYALDLKNFHKGSHELTIFPILVCTDADDVINDFLSDEDGVYRPILVNSANLATTLQEVQYIASPDNLEPLDWENAPYLPTPTIIEAAQALYTNHTVEQITRHEAGAKNLAETSACIEGAILSAQSEGSKCICFVTGVPGAGKTLAGLNIATKFLRHEDDNSVFLSGNGPLVEVLREALARNRVLQSSTIGVRETLGSARRRTKTFVQNIHQFRDFYVEHLEAPPDRVVVFDEAQRAWTRHQLEDFMRRKRGHENFGMSEPHFLIDVMDRHKASATIVCLVGGGQEINRGEAGLGEWIRALRDFYPDWRIFVSDKIITDPIYIEDDALREWIRDQAIIETDLHLSVPVRSFRSEKLAEFVEAVLGRDETTAAELLQHLYQDNYPIFLTRDLNSARSWLRTQARGNERYGLVASSGAHRLRPLGLSVREDVDAPIWFLNGKHDIRSSYYLEEVATEFSIQGLELDWTGVCWDGDLHLRENQWVSRRFSGTNWQNINLAENRRYLLNAYRVILTRARQGMVIFVPKGDPTDRTRLPEFYDGTFEFLARIGMKQT